jgi:hypothetical protein
MAASKIRSRANRNLAGGFLRSLNPLFTCDYWASKSPTSFASSLCARNRRSRGLKPERCGSPFLFDRDWITESRRRPTAWELSQFNRCHCRRSSPKAKVTIRMPRSANLLWSAEPRLAGLRGSTVIAFAGGCPDAR